MKNNINGLFHPIMVCAFFLFFNSFVNPFDISPVLFLLSCNLSPSLCGALVYSYTFCPLVLSLDRTPPLKHRDADLLHTTRRDAILLQ